MKGRKVSNINSFKSALTKASLVIAAFALVIASYPMGSARAISYNCPTDLLSSLTPTGTTNHSDSNAVNVGTKFVVHGAGAITGVKFYKGVDNTGTHVAHLYDMWNETELASATFTSESSSGWQSVNFANPVDVTDTSTYLVWVSMPAGHYAADGGDAGGTYGFNNGYIGKFSDPLQLQGGMYSYTTDNTVVPANSSTANYWVSPVVKDDATPTANSGFTVTDAAAGPVLSWTGTGTETNSVTSNASPAATLITRQASGGDEQVIGWQEGASAIFFGVDGDNGYAPNDPTALPGTTYTYRVKNYGGCGNVSTAATATVTTASQSLENVFGSTAPTSLAASDGNPVTLGNSFTSDVNGQVWGVRFYRSGQNVPTGGFRIYLWDDSGNLLARTVMIAGSEQSGWIEARFATPVNISANQRYVAGYYAPDGQYSYTPNKFSTSYSSTHLTMLQDTVDHANGLYAYGLGYHVPTNSYNSTWYGVDVNFIPGN